MNNKNEVTRKKRKDEHIHMALKTSPTNLSHFDQISFVHQSLPNIALKDVSLKVSFSEFKLSTPLYINAMTGGSLMTGNINAALAEIAHATGMAMAVGSQHAGLKDNSLINTYRVVREKNPNGVIFANVGADVLTESALRAVDMIEADALQIHLNAPQELVMPEGGRDFTGWLHQIEQIIKHIEVPVIVKEVGFGVSKETLNLLESVGVKYVDVGGRGGTNFIEIEDHRREQLDYKYLNGWGQTTAISLMEA